MTDPTDVLVTAVVSGVVSLIVSVLVPRYLHERDRLRQDDKVDIFEPMRREMTGILDNERLMDSGYGVWTRSEAFSDILKRGALNPRRLRDLREDIHRLVELGDAHENERVRFYDVREGEMQKAWDATRVTGSEFSGPITLRSSPIQYNNEQFLKPLAQGSRAAWLHAFDMAVRLMENQTGGAVVVATSPERIFDQVDAAVKSARDEFRASAQALIEEARLISGRLDVALAGKLVYRAA